MAADGASDAYPSPPPSPSKGKSDAIIRNALRYTVSSNEYETLHRYLISRTPRAVRKTVPSPQKYNALLHSKDDFNAAAVRASVRIFITSQLGLKAWDLITTYLLARGRPRKKPTTSTILSTNFRLSLSFSTIILLHRLLFRFFARLRANLLTKDAAPFRRRNPRIARSLTSRLAPAIGASLAGFALGIYPPDQLRITAAIYVATRSIEFAYNVLEGDGWFKNKPWWWGSWMLMPLATGQLLHAFVFDRDCFPKAYGDFILEHTPNYVQRRPPTYPPSLPWPSTNTTVDSLAEMSRLNWPPFISPILFPNSTTTLPPTLTSLAPITSPAHPSHTSLSCATLHPSDPSCTRTLTHYTLTAFPSLFKFFTAFYTVFSLPHYQKLLASPPTFLTTLLKRAFRTSTFLTGAIGTAWGSICLFQALLPRTVLPSSRWFLGGFIAGLWALVDRQGGREQVLYSARMSIDSLWKVGRKRGWWRGVGGGDVLVFVAGLAVAEAVYETRPGAVGSGAGKGIAWLRGDGGRGKKEEA